MRRSPLILLLLLVVAPILLSWVSDPLLRDSYRSETVSQPDDYAGKVVSTVVRRLPAGTAPRRAVLYVHGYNDYFFQGDMGKIFNDSGYGFYAVDLRKYGRSLLPGQRRYEARSLTEYFPDIDSAVARMKADGVEEIALMGHSTGGLISALYMEEGNPSPLIKALILNSPFLDWNFTGFMRHVAIPVVAALGKWFPNISIPQGDNTAYGESLLKRYHGEWEYDTTLKLLHPAPITAGWVRAIDRAQKQLMKNGRRIRVPILLMHSDNSLTPEAWSPAVNSADVVLNADSIRARGRRLGYDITDATVRDGVHDLVLSAPAVRRDVYCCIFRFLSRQKAFAPEAAPARQRPAGKAAVCPPRAA